MKFTASPAVSLHYLPVPGEIKNDKKHILKSVVRMPSIEPVVCNFCQIRLLQFLYMEFFKRVFDQNFYLKTYLIGDWFIT